MGHSTSDNGRRVGRTIVVVCIALIAALARAGEPSVTIYNQQFGVVRENLHLDLAKGVNQISFNDTTAHLEPDSVMLRDPSGKINLRILEQNYRADPVSQDLLLSLNEGKFIDFIIQNGDKRDIVQGKVVRSNYMPHAAAFQRYGQQYYQQQMAYAQSAGGGQPIIEIYGKLHFGLPGQPLFPALPDDSIMKPTLTWTLESDAAGPLDAEIGYVTGGMTWDASYNLVAPKQGDKVDLVGWVTMDNQSGKTFENARIKLMAGNVSKIQPQNMGLQEMDAMKSMSFGGGGFGPAVTEKAFDEFHLYTVERMTTLRDRETKQVEFVRADGITSTRFYVYDGAKIDQNQYRGYSTEALMQQRDYGTQSNKLVWVMREFANTKENGLGIPLPAGKTRFYQRDDDKQLEFTGENVITHTPQGETVRVYTGDAFDLVGERKQSDYKVDYNAHWVDESFEIKVRNRKKEPAEIRVVEHLYRGNNWEIRNPSIQFTKTDSRTVEFRVSLQPDEEKVVTYLVHYTW